MNTIILLFLLIVIVCIVVIIIYQFKNPSAIVGGADETISYDLDATRAADEFLLESFDNIDGELPDMSDAAVGGGGPAVLNVKWQNHSTWDELYQDKDSLYNYLQYRRNAITTPDFDWSKVEKKIKPYMDKNVEYVGVIRVENDGRTLFIYKMQASPYKVNFNAHDSTVASVPHDLVEKYSAIPGVFFFHTHPAKDGIFPLPSSTDMLTAIKRSSKSLFVGDVLISKLGVFVYGIDFVTIQTLKGQKNYKYAIANYSLDIICYLESLRSLLKYTYEDIMRGLRAYGIFMFAYTNSEYVKDSRRHLYLQSLEYHGDTDILNRCIANVIHNKV